MVSSVSPTLSRLSSCILVTYFLPSFCLLPLLMLATVSLSYKCLQAVSLVLSGLGPCLCSLASMQVLKYCEALEIGAQEYKDELKTAWTFELDN